ncbi:MAG: F0F1 ATP synthase subunit delta [Gammaproteobacteria bacterium]|nr:F0F1 ATP synthase subunit delta [Gammaproteobacteria bacterium]
MSDNTTAARPYARAVFESAQGDSSLAKWSELLSFLSSVVSNEDMSDALDSPHIGALEKGELLIEVCAGDLTDANRNFVKLLAENGRLKLMPEITALYEEFRAEAESKVEAVVTSAFPLSDAQQQAMTAALKKKLGCEVTLVTEIDETLIGGVVIRAGDLVIDGSAQAKLAALAHTLTH